ncbi:MAG: addiction module protein [Burkholderiaceae bacterium]
MSALAEELSRKALALSPEERVWLAEELLATVHEEDPEVEAAWDVEIKRRITEIENGTAKLIPAEEVFAEIRRMIK